MNVEHEVRFSIHVTGLISMLWFYIKVQSFWLLQIMDFRFQNTGFSFLTNSDWKKRWLSSSVLSNFEERIAISINISACFDVLVAFFLYFVLLTKLTFVTHCMEKQNWQDFSDGATRCWVPEMQSKIKTIQGNAFDIAHRSRETVSLVFPTLDKRVLTKSLRLPRASRVCWLNAVDSELGCNLFQCFAL